MSRQTTLKRALVRVRESVEDWALAARANLLPVQSLDLFTFSNEDVVSRFQITTDRVVGGEAAGKARNWAVGGLPVAAARGQLSAPSAPCCCLLCRQD